MEFGPPPPPPPPPPPVTSRSSNRLAPSHASSLEWGGYSEMVVTEVDSISQLASGSLFPASRTNSEYSRSFTTNSVCTTAELDSWNVSPLPEYPPYNMRDFGKSLEGSMDRLVIRDTAGAVNYHNTGPPSHHSHSSANYHYVSGEGKDSGSTSSGGRPGAKGNGYRRLWQEVRRVNKGQKLGDSGCTGFSDVTVDDLLQVVKKLTPNESAVEAVEHGLLQLDSSAAAAFLKELSKQGGVNRAVEVFDWLRKLPTNHELAHLCDLYTYTTMISQCGSHQQLRRALELVAEMRSRGIQCNVHTYSALMNVCIKANELDLAKDVYQQMLDEGCKPNLVTYNILIDVQVRRGQWEEAVKILSQLEEKGIRAEVRTYNTVICACNKSSEPEQALKVFDMMLANGLKPSATTFTALITAHGRKGQVEKALEIYQDMVNRGCEPNVITYSSLISACEKAGRWELAFVLFDKMHLENVKPNVVTYNSLIAACTHGGLWEKASGLFEKMQTEDGCRPDSITYSALINAYEKGGQWRFALKALEQMQAQGCTPDAAVFNSLMEVLWQSGVALAQVRALQLWSQANKYGQFRIYTNSRAADVLHYSSVNFTAGAAIVTLLRWLFEMRNKLVKEGQGFFHDKVSFTLHKSKLNRVEQPLVVIHEAINGLLKGASSPFSITTTNQSVVLETNAADLVIWLKSPEFDDAVKKVSTNTIFSEDVVTATQCAEAFHAVRRIEDGLVMNVASYCPSVMQQRTQVVILGFKYCGAFGLREDTTYDGLQLFDKPVHAHEIASPPAFGRHFAQLALSCSLCMHMKSLPAFAPLFAHLPSLFQSLHAS
eukprot:gene31556-6743_t